MKIKIAFKKENTDQYEYFINYNVYLFKIYNIFCTIIIFAGLDLGHLGRLFLKMAF